MAFKVGDGVKVVNPERSHFGCHGKVAAEGLINLAVALYDENGRHFGSAVYEPDELELIPNEEKGGTPDGSQ